MTVKDDVIGQNDSSYKTDMISMFRRSRTPRIDLDVSSGNPIDYPYFITSFGQVVETNVRDQRGRLSLLVKYTQGEAKELVKSCVYLSDDISYKRAKELLKQKYGNPHKIAADYRKQLSSWSKIKPNDPSAFSKFETFLMKYQASMVNIGREHNCSPEL